MRFARRFTLAALIMLALAPARAAEPAHDCLDQKERLAESESGRVVRLDVALRATRSKMPGTLVRARLCRSSDGLVYVLTVLARDGKVATARRGIISARASPTMPSFSTSGCRKWTASRCWNPGAVPAAPCRF
jgi:hypothetical protein